MQANFPADYHLFRFLWESGHGAEMLMNIAVLCVQLVVRLVVLVDNHILYAFVILSWSSTTHWFCVLALALEIIEFLAFMLNFIQIHF